MTRRSDDGRRRRRLTRCLAAFTLGLLPWVAGAGAFSVIPVRLSFGPRDRAVAVTLHNLGDTPVVLTAEIFSWTQRPDGTEQLAPTDDVLLAPPLIRLLPKAQQVVRLALLRAPDPHTQLAYRMIVRELPEPGQAAGSVAMPISIALNLPIFVTPADARWIVDCGAEIGTGRPEVRCRNTGNAAVLMRSARMEKDGATIASFDGGAYLLPGASRPISLEPRPAPAALPAALVLTFENDQKATFPLAAGD